MTKRPHILITNDDGITAEGIRVLWHALYEIADLSVVAPATEQSAVGLGITIREPLHIQRMDHFKDSDAWSVSGTPADCVKMGISYLLQSPPDLIVSGINRGSNAGRGLMYSGTVAAAIEGVMHDIPGIAFSCVSFVKPDYEQTIQHAIAIVKHLLEHPLPRGTILNVNFPEGPIKGMKLTNQGKEHWAEDPVERVNPAEMQKYYWLGAKLVQFEEQEDSDIMWLRKGYATAVPIYVGELTNKSYLLAQRDHFEAASLQEVR